MLSRISVALFLFFMISVSVHADIRIPQSPWALYERPNADEQSFSRLLVSPVIPVGKSIYYIDSENNILSSVVSSIKLENYTCVHFISLEEFLKVMEERKQSSDWTTRFHAERNLKLNERNPDYWARACNEEKVEPVQWTDVSQSFNSVPFNASRVFDIRTMIGHAWTSDVQETSGPRISKMTNLFIRIHRMSENVGGRVVDTFFMIDIKMQ